MTTRVLCPNCGHEIELEAEVQQGGWLLCPYCDVDLYVVDLPSGRVEMLSDGPEVAGLPHRLRYMQ